MSMLPNQKEIILEKAYICTLKIKIMVAKKGNVNLFKILLTAGDR